MEILHIGLLVEPNIQELRLRVYQIHIYQKQRNPTDKLNICLSIVGRFVYSDAVSYKSFFFRLRILEMNEC